LRIGPIIDYLFYATLGFTTAGTNSPRRSPGRSALNSVTSVISVVKSYRTLAAIVGPASVPAGVRLSPGLFVIARPVEPAPLKETDDLVSDVFVQNDRGVVARHHHEILHLLQFGPLQGHGTVILTGQNL
jgi:hypothetical protein